MIQSKSLSSWKRSCTSFFSQRLCMQMKSPLYKLQNCFWPPYYIFQGVYSISCAKCYKNNNGGSADRNNVKTHSKCLKLLSRTMKNTQSKSEPTLFSSSVNSQIMTVKADQSSQRLSQTISSGSAKLNCLLNWQSLENFCKCKRNGNWYRASLEQIIQQKLINH